MTKKVVVRVAARGYVDGRYIGEEKEVIEAIDPSGHGKRKRGKTKARQGGANAGANDNRGNRSSAKSGANGAKAGRRSPAAGAPRADRGAGSGRPPRVAGRPPPLGGGSGNAVGNTVGGNALPGAPGKRRKKARGGKNTVLPVFGTPGIQDNAVGPPKSRRNRAGRKTPFRSGGAPVRQGLDGPRALISEVAESRRWGDETKTGQFADALAKESQVKRERLHKVLAQSGHGSRRDMEIMITSGRVMVNGIVATIGTSVSPSDSVMIDRHLVKLKFSEELPRILLYHKPEGEIVTTSDPGNRITVFDNLPRVENGKWMSVGRLDINTSGLLIFTTSGELANRLMHPRYEVEREYAVRVLGELTEEQQALLLSGVSITTEEDDEIDEPVDDRPAKFDSIEARGGEGANHWYHVVLREGRNREVRKMFEAVGLTVSRLIRVRFGKIGLPPRLTRGRMLELDAAQSRAVLRWVGMETEGPVGQLPMIGGGPRPPRPPRPARPPKAEAAVNAAVDGETDFEVGDAVNRELAGVALGGGVGASAGPDARPTKEGGRGRSRRGRGRRMREGRVDNTVYDASADFGSVDGATSVAIDASLTANASAPSAAPSGDRAREPRPAGNGRRESRNTGGRIYDATPVAFGGQPGGSAAPDFADDIGNTISGNRVGAATLPQSSGQDEDPDDAIGNRIGGPAPSSYRGAPGGSGARPSDRRPSGGRRKSTRRGGGGGGGNSGDGAGNR
jgi:23S rRNA pseudouridine2605 synthase